MVEEAEERAAGESPLLPGSLTAAAAAVAVGAIGAAAGVMVVVAAAAGDDDDNGNMPPFAVAVGEPASRPVAVALPLTVGVEEEVMGPAVSLILNASPSEKADAEAFCDC